ncbi:MAG: hypothetical protein V4724_20445 [Pseudomonadota bacterium]
MLGLSVMPAIAQQRVVSLGTTPAFAALDADGAHGVLVRLVQAMDKASASSSRIVIRPFGRSLQETADAHASFHLPLIQLGDMPAPAGLAYVKEVDFGHVNFVIYSSRRAPLRAKDLAYMKRIEVEPGHEALFPFPVRASYCLACSLRKVTMGRIDALLVSSHAADPLLNRFEFGEIHRALYGVFPVRAVVPSQGDSTETRRYLIEAARRIKDNGDFERIFRYAPYTDWQPALR